MNIYCEWSENKLFIKSGNTLVGYVEEVCGEPVLFMTYIEDTNSSLTFNEIEYVMDNWHNMPKK